MLPNSFSLSFLLFLWYNYVRVVVCLNFVNSPESVGFSRSTLLNPNAYKHYGTNSLCTQNVLLFLNVNQLILPNGIYLMVPRANKTNTSIHIHFCYPNDHRYELCICFFVIVRYFEKSYWIFFFLWKINIINPIVGRRANKLCDA